jgi:HAE1 family hydrophobic/amphiphilic exporter-1
MTSIWDICIRRPVFTTMVILAPIVLGLASYSRLGVELFPNVDVPVVVVTTTLRGASVDEMEASVTKPVEEAVNTVSGIDQLGSTTKEGFSQILVAFKLEKNGDIAAQEIRDKMSLIQGQLPPGTDYPKVEKFNLDATPIVTIVVSGKRPLREVTEIAKKLIKQDIEGNVYGVGTCVLVGGQQRAINVTVNPDNLHGRGLSVFDVRKALSEQNQEQPGGRIDQGNREQILRTDARVKAVADFPNLVIAHKNGHSTRLAEVGTVVDGYEEPRGLSRMDGDVAVSLVVQKQSGGNTVKVADAVKARLEVIQKTLPPDIRMEVIRDQSKFIKGSIEEVKFHLLLAALLVSGVLVMFIRDWRTTVIAALAVPTSIIGTFALMDLMGFSLNNMTLLGLILAVGIVIDDAVVVLENVFRHMEEYGRTPREAASVATKEIALAVLATTLSLVVVFAPVAFMTGQVGRFFNSFGFVVGFAIILSLVVSFTLTPMLCARFLRAPKLRQVAPLNTHPSRNGYSMPSHSGAEAEPGKLGFIVEPMTPIPTAHSHSEGTDKGFWRKVTRWYVGLLGWCLGGWKGWRRWIVVAAAVACFLSTPLLVMAVGTDFVPKDDQSEFEVALTLPEGYSLDEASQVCREIELRLAQVRGVTNVFTTIGETNGRNAKGQGDVTRVLIYCRMVDLRQRSFPQKDAMADARAILADYPDLRGTVQEVKLFSSSAFKNVQVELYLIGPDGDKLDEYAAKLVRQMRMNPVFTDVDTNATARSPEVQVRMLRQQAGDLNVSPQVVAATLGILVGGEPVSKFKEPGQPDLYDVWLRADLNNRDRKEAITQLTVPNAAGELVELDRVATLVDARGPATIERYNRQRCLVVTANLIPGAVLGKELPPLAKTIEALNMPPEYRYEFLGEAKLMADSNSNFLLAFLLAFAFMYMILAAQFESLVHPITILLAVPLTLPFALVSLLLLRTALDVYAMIGLFMLFGIVKKNGILQVDYTNVLRAKGIARDQAILRANEARLRPILMTTIMLVAAMIPIATGQGPGASARASMAKVILGGQALSLLLSLLITPVAYSLWDDFAALLRNLYRRLRRSKSSPVVSTPAFNVETIPEDEGMPVLLIPSESSTRWPT